MEDAIKVTKELLPKSMVKLTIAVGKEEYEKYVEKAYYRLSKDVVVKGFRKGKAPKELITEALGVSLYDEALNMLLTQLANKAVEQENLSPVGTPSFSVTTFNPEKEIIFTVTFAVYPTVEIGDLATIKIPQEDVQKALEAQKPKSKQTKKETERVEKKETEKQDTFNLDHYYSSIIDKVLGISSVEIPDTLIDHELEHHIEDFTHRLKELDIQTEDYLKMQNTTMEEAKKKWRDDISFSLKQDFLLVEYAKQKKIEANKEEVEEELTKIYPDQKLDTIDKSMYNYVSFALVRQKAFLHLIDYIEKNNEKSTTSKHTNTNSH